MLISFIDDMQLLVPWKKETVNFRFNRFPPALHQAVKMVRGEMGLKNVEIMIPFVRTLDMAKDVNEVLVPWTLLGGELKLVEVGFNFSSRP